jgi:cell division protein FtsW
MKRETTILLVIVLTLVFIGLVTAYSIFAVKQNGMGTLERQAISLFIGIAAMLYIATHFDYHRFALPWVFRGIAFVSLLLLFLVLVPGVGVEVNGAQRWIRLAGFQLQPSEFAKASMIILLALKLSDNRGHVHELWRGFIPPMFIAGAFAALVLMERDLGIPVVLVSCAFVMVFIAGVRWYYIFGSIAPAVIGVVALIKMNPYRGQRLAAFMDPFLHRNEGGFHLIQSLAAFAHGSMFGVGPGAGEQKLFYLPAAHNDFIFAVWGEEMGLLGTTLVLLLFCAFMVIGIRIARSAPDMFGSLLATGVVSLITLQAVLNMGVTIGLLPTKGLTLPYLSCGGTAQIVFLALTGILINIGLQAEAPEERREFALAF